jgi:hypothetical protein
MTTNEPEVALLNLQAARRAYFRCLKALRKRDPESITAFARASIDWNEALKSFDEAKRVWEDVK